MKTVFQNMCSEIEIEGNMRILRHLGCMKQLASLCTTHALSLLHLASPIVFPKVHFEMKIEGAQCNSPPNDDIEL